MSGPDGPRSLSRKQCISMQERITRPLDSQNRGRLYLEVQRRGETPTMNALGISRTALARALASLPIYGSTRKAIELGLDVLPAINAGVST